MAQRKATASPVNTFFTGAASPRLELPPVLKKMTLLSAEWQQCLQFHDISRNNETGCKNQPSFLYNLSLSLSRSPLDLICTSYCMILYAYVYTYSPSDLDILTLYYRLHHHVNIYLSAVMQRLAGQ